MLSERAPITAPSRSPQSLTTSRCRPRCSTRVESTTAPMGRSGARRAWIPGRARRASRSSVARRSASSCSWPAGSLHLIDLDRRGRLVTAQRSVEHHGQAGQGPDRPATGDDPGPGSRTAGQHGADGLGSGQGDLGDRLPVGRGQQLAGAQLTPEPGRAEGHADHLGHLVDGADARLQAPTTEIEAEDRLLTHPDAGPLPEEAQPGLLLAGEQGDRTSQDLLEAAEELGPVGRVAEGGRGQRHHDVDARVVRRSPEPTHRAHRRGGPVGGHAPGPGHLGPEVEERPAAQHRGQHSVPGRVDHHQVERAAAQVEDGDAHGRHRRDATGNHPSGEKPSSRWPTLGRSYTGRVDGRHHGT